MKKKFKFSADRLFWALASLELAIVILVTFTIALIAGTILESVYDTASAQYWVYRAGWFKFIFVALAVNLFMVMVSRWPWKRRHIPFLLAHTGILILLIGGWLTDRTGIDGTMRVSEGETSSSVEFDQPIFVLSDAKDVYSIPVKWQPPGVRFKGLDFRSRSFPYQLKIDQFISHAEPVFEFSQKKEKSSTRTPAIRLKISGGPMRISQEYWLWTGQAEWTAFQAGPAWVGMQTPMPMPASGPRLMLVPGNAGNDASVTYRSWSSSGEKIQGKLKITSGTKTLIPVNWKGGVKISVEEWVPNAMLKTSYRPSRTQYREMAPPSAIHVIGDNNMGIWLGMGDRAPLTVDGKEVEVGYFNKRVVLPFALRLDRFSIEHYEGSFRPASYSSKVTVVDARNAGDLQKQVEISMNEPLELSGYTVYQASYEEATPRPVTSIFSVNRDPGRWLKYIGSLLIVLGSILLFAAKYRQKGASK